MIGRTLSHYRISAKLGEGGMGAVYRATDTKLGREVALKVLRSDAAADLEHLDRFRREARAIASLNHPHIVTLYSVEDVDDVHFLTMELVEGQSLDQAVSADGLAIDRLLAVAVSIADALAAAHDKGIVHRDLKPANVMVAVGGRVKVLDFGLAKDTRPAASDGATVTSAGRTAIGIVLGTPAYMSPEQVAGQTLDYRTDLFSFGVLLYELAAGQRPFAGRSLPELMSSILRDAPRSLSTVRAGVPEAFSALVERCLSKDAAGRPSGADDIRLQLEAMREGLRSGSNGRPETASRQPPAVGNLPAAVDTFVARQAELAEVAAFLTSARLVTLVGAGGTGKTRLALEVAARVSDRFADGAWLVELAPVTKADAVAHVVADVVGAVQQPGKTLTESLVDSLRHRAVLLVLDNCEHVLDATAELAAVVTTRCPAVRVLATSRENLSVRGEQVVRLESLSDEHGARLFRDRAVAAGAKSDLDMVTLARLSQRLDGMPLAIELAAARCGSMTPEEIDRRLDDRFRLLRGAGRGRMERHHTLRNTVAWSYDLLEPIERHVFDRLSVFAGGCTLQAAKAVAGGDDLEVEDAIASLVTRSMVLASETKDGTRYRLLETLRQFGEEQLTAAGALADTRLRHLDVLTAFMAAAWSGLWGVDDMTWIRRVGREFENLRVAVFVAIDRQDRTSLTTLLTPHMWWAWHAQRYEVGDWAEAALAVQPEPASARAIAIHLHTHGGRPERALRLTAGLGPRPDGSDPDAMCLWTWGQFDASIVAASPEMMSRLVQWIEAGQGTAHAAQAAAIKSIETVFRAMAGEMDEARRVAHEAYERAEASGNQTALCWATFMMGRAHSDSEPRLALAHFDRAAEIAERADLPLLGGLAATEAAVVIARAEEPNLGRGRLSRALRVFINSGDRRQLWTSTHHLAYFLTRAGLPDKARSLWQELADRQGWAAQHHRDELAELLGPPGTGALSDDEFVDRIRDVLDTLDDGP